MQVRGSSWRRMRSANGFEDTGFGRSSPLVLKGDIGRWSNSGLLAMTPSNFSDIHLRNVTNLESLVAYTASNQMFLIFWADGINYLGVSVASHFITVFNPEGST